MKILIVIVSTVVCLAGCTPSSKSSDSTSPSVASETSKVFQASTDPASLLNPSYEIALNSSNSVEAHIRARCSQLTYTGYESLGLASIPDGNLTISPSLLDSQSIAKRYFRWGLGGELVSTIDGAVSNRLDTGWDFIADILLADYPGKRQFWVVCTRTVNGSAQTGVLVFEDADGDWNIETSELLREVVADGFSRPCSMTYMRGKIALLDAESKEIILFSGEVDPESIDTFTGSFVGGGPNPQTSISDAERKLVRIGLDAGNVIVDVLLPGALTDSRTFERFADTNLDGIADTSSVINPVVPPYIVFNSPRAEDTMMYIDVKKGQHYRVFDESGIELGQATASEGRSAYQVNLNRALVLGELITVEASHLGETATYSRAAVGTTTQDLHRIIFPDFKSLRTGPNCKEVYVAQGAGFDPSSEVVFRFESEDSNGVDVVTYISCPTVYIDGHTLTFTVPHLAKPDIYSPQVSVRVQLPGDTTPFFKGGVTVKVWLTFDE